MDSMRMNCSIKSLIEGQSGAPSALSGLATGTGTITIPGGSTSTNSTLSTHLFSMRSILVPSRHLALLPGSKTNSSSRSSSASRSVQCDGRTKFREASMSPRRSRSATLGMTVMDWPGLTGSIVSTKRVVSSADFFWPSSLAVISLCSPSAVSMKARTTVRLFRTSVRSLFQFWTPWVTSKRITCTSGSGHWVNSSGGSMCIAVLSPGTSQCGTYSFCQ